MLRYGRETYRVQPGDVVLSGGETAHQLINSGASDLRYLAISTMIEPDISEYPDSGKFGVMVGAPPGGNAGARRF